MRNLKHERKEIQRLDYQQNLGFLSDYIIYSIG